jgi:hypothetical protein
VNEGRILMGFMGLVFLALVVLVFGLDVAVKWTALLIILGVLLSAVSFVAGRTSRHR